MEKMATAFIHGFLLAFGLILPLGVQNVFIFSQGGYHHRYTRAWPAIIAAAVSDTALILAAVFGVSVAVLGFHWLRLTLIISGIVFLTYMGWSTWKSGDILSSTANEATEWSTHRQIIFAVSVSLLNPHAILDTIVVIGTSSLAYNGYALVAYTAACILVSWLWFFGLAAVGRMVRATDRSGHFFGSLNRISALIMWGSGIYLLVGLLGSRG